MLVKKIGAGKESAIGAFKVAEAAVSCGASSRSLSRMTAAGAGGKAPGNLERDICISSRRLAGVPWRLYPVEALGRKKGRGVEPITFMVLLPHEFFAVLYKYDRKSFDDIFGLDHVQIEYWRRIRQLNEDWFLAHPCKGILDSPGFDAAKLHPYRFLGDDTGLRKTRNVAVFHWTPLAGCRLDPKRSRIPAYVIPLHFCLPDVTLAGLHEVLRWSFAALLEGTFPMTDHRDVPWPSNSTRGKLAGRPLAEGRRAAFVGSVADWKWSAEVYKPGQTWATAELCMRCFASRDVGPCNFTAFAPCPARPNSTFVAKRTSALVDIPGWHILLVLPEVMHAGPLGHLASLSGSILTELCREHCWPGAVGAGEWKDKMQVQLNFAFDEFCLWLKKEHRDCSLTGLTPAKLGLHTLAYSWPEFKTKAHDALEVLEWLAVRSRQESSGSDYHELRAAVAWATHNWFHILRQGGDWIDNPSTLAELDESAALMFHGYNKLSETAAAAAKPLYKCLPKMHVLFEAHLDLMKTGRNPTSYWTFSDEGNMRVIGDTACAVHGSTVSQRTLERWLNRYFCGAD